MSENRKECELKNKIREKQVRKAGNTFKTSGQHQTIAYRLFKDILSLKMKKREFQEEKTKLEEEISFYQMELTRLSYDNSGSQNQMAMHSSYNTQQSSCTYSPPIRMDSQFYEDTSQINFEDILRQTLGDNI
ncbi:hypothetical protein LOD99_16036 [Oopsacas minuta]|uniref:BZIP domain-containing protein n=1 Tax=Oopsacas minuta TaxID=111878 RepID=A0AAV7K626_9METZ|nr:hypothetical protein LOD99_16036 [Oopsacas minuta]